MSDLVAPRRGLKKSNLVLLAALAVCAAVLGAQAWYAWVQTPADDGMPFIDLADRFGDLDVERDAAGVYTLHAPTDEGVQALTPERFAEIIHAEKSRQAEAGWLFVIFNITTWWGLVWVSVGFFGQVFFTFRMVLQWLASEKQHKSVVPTSFWWGSLIGGAMLLTYFVWRKDAIGILGQSTGTFIYARNLWLIYAAARRPPAPDAPGTPGSPGATPVPAAGAAHA